MNRKKKWLRKLGISLLISALLTGLLLITCNWLIDRYATNYTFDSYEQLPNWKVGLVLGTSKRLAGRPNPYFVYRIEAAAELYWAGKVRYLIVSGDNSTRYYNEPKDMKQALMKKGIPEQDIYLDFAGFRTLDSVIRCREIFGQNQVIVISQKFHNERAVFIASRFGIDALGYNAKDVSPKVGFETNVRELFARVKVFIDIYLTKQQPKFLGEKVTIR